MALSKEEVHHMIEMVQLRYATERSVMDSGKTGEYVDLDKLSDKDLSRYGVKIEE